MRAQYAHYTLRFKNKAVTSRNVLTERDTFYISITDDTTGARGIGECALFRGLGDDDRPDYEARLRGLCRAISHATLPNEIPVPPYTSLRFGFETALADLANGGTRCPFPSPWSQGKGEIAINGLIWMGNAREMLTRIDEKLAKGFRCVKLKIGGIDFNEELRLLSYIRKRFSPDSLELRLDANGAFSPDVALQRLEILSHFGIHSIEQPIRQGQPAEMRHLCALSPIPIALDEELIGCRSIDEKRHLLDTINPRYIILKPSLCGGFASADEWISEAEKRGIGWWATSALESNIGLNAIAQWVSRHNPVMPQGLGTGMLYVNNIDSPLVQTRDVLTYNPQLEWRIPDLNWHD